MVYTSILGFLNKCYDNIQYRQNNAHSSMFSCANMSLLHIETEVLNELLNLLIKSVSHGSTCCTKMLNWNTFYSVNIMLHRVHC